MTRAVWKKSDDPKVKELAERIEGKARKKAVEGKIKCAEAFALAKEEGVSIMNIGQALNLLNIKISSCQLGCF